MDRHNSTNIAEDGKPTYAPPHDVNFHSIIWALKHLNVKGVIAIGSTGTLHPKEVHAGTPRSAASSTRARAFTVIVVHHNKPNQLEQDHQRKASENRATPANTLCCSVAAALLSQVPVGSLLMPDDYFCVLPTPVTFWPYKVGAMEPGAGEVGRIHFAPAGDFDAPWTTLRSWVKQTLNAKCEAVDAANAEVTMMASRL